MATRVVETRDEREKRLPFMQAFISLGPYDSPPQTGSADATCERLDSYLPSSPSEVRNPRFLPNRPGGALQKLQTLLKPSGASLLASLMETR